MSGGDNPLAYGRYYEGDNSQQGGERGLSDSARGFLSDGLRKFKDHYGSQGQGQGQGQYQQGQGQQSQGQQGQQNHNYGSGPTQSGSYQQQPQQPQQPPQQPPTQHQQYQSSKPDRLSGFLGKFQDTVSGVGIQLAQKIGTTIDADGYSQYGSSNPSGGQRFKSFAPPRENNDVKWHVDGFSYFWAVSLALESARESIWILDWWLSPELYLRRPPAKNEQYRLDRLLQAAAQRGVRVNIIVYKEVEKALTLSSAHTKHTLEALHPNIQVFRHPDHLPDGNEIKNSLAASFQNLSFDGASLSKLPSDTVKAFYGTKGDTVLFWAHHEKLLLVDGKIAFMGGLDLCFGRWDTNQHAIADVHPADLREIVFPGQDYNNARVLDFQDVSHWEQNQLDRKATSRIGWSDISISLRGPAVEDLRRHFVDRWNYIFDTKYYARNEAKYQKLSLYRQSGYGGQPGNAPPGAPAPAAVPGVATQQSQQGQQGQQGQPQPPNQGHLSQDPHWQQSSAPATQSYPHPGQQQPQWQGQQSTTQSYPPPPSQGQQQQQPQWQGQQTSSTPSYPPPPESHGQQQSQPQWQGQSSAPSSTQSYPPPPESHGQQQPQWQGQQQSTTSPQGQYFPPPPPGPPPAHTGSEYTSQQAQSPAPGQYGSHTPTPTQTTQTPYFAPPPTQESQSQTRGVEEDFSRGYGSNLPGYSTEYQGNGKSTTQNFLTDVRGLSHSLRGQLAGQVHQYQDRYITNLGRPAGTQLCQVVRSCSQWSGGIPVEHSIQEAYIAAIRNSQHFVYIENQFFITATGDEQKPVQNKIGAAIVERILRAARAGQKYKIIVVIPAVPGFAGDLRDDSSLGTRAIMEFQYNSINRGGHSIMELIAKEGFNPMEYIRFYNLRNYDRINTNSTMVQAEKASGVSYEDARRYHDAAEVGSGGYGPGAPARGYDTTQPYDQYQKAATAHPSATSGRWDSVSECYMLGGEDIRKVPWDSDLPEIDAFVSEELYVHSKVMIVDDRIAIVGSANLNDRSQLGTHDSEIALVIEDPTPVDSKMDGQQWQASRFAASLRRELSRKHLGLLKPQDYTRPNANCEPVGVPNDADLNSPESQVVADPLSSTFQSLWNSRAHTNTEIFRKVFNPVPDDYVRNWDAYKEFYEYNFRKADIEAEGKRVVRPGKYEWGHVVRDNFAPGPEGAQQVKELLSQVKGTLVEMPLMFLIEEDIAKEGLTLNALTEEVYT